MRLALPLSMILAPNDFSFAQHWDLKPGFPSTLWMEFFTRDALTGQPLPISAQYAFGNPPASTCPRRYIAPTPATVLVTFPQKVGLFPAPAVRVFATGLAEDRSTWSLSLSALQIEAIGSGTVKIEIGTGSTIETFVPTESFCLVGGVKVTGPCADGC